MEWDLSLYINFVDYEKAFDNLDKETLWKLLQHYGIPEKLISLIRSTYDGMICKVIRAGQLTTDSFTVKTGLRRAPSVTFPLPADHRLDNEEDHRK